MREKIIILARSCVGTKFRHQGRIPGRGLDCVGLIRYPAVTVGLYGEEADEFGYSSEPNPDAMENALLRWLDRISVKDILPADILWLKSPQPQHLAVYTGETIIHSDARRGKVIEHGYRDPFPRLVVGAWRYRGIDG